MCIGILPTCMPVHSCLMLAKAREGIRCLVMELEMLLSHYVGQGKSNPGPLNKQQVFLTAEPSLSSTRENFSLVLRQVSLCSPGSPGNHSVDQASFKFTEIFLPLPPECWD